MSSLTIFKKYQKNNEVLRIASVKKKTWILEFSPKLNAQVEHGQKLANIHKNSQ